MYSPADKKCRAICFWVISSLTTIFWISKATHYSFTTPSDKWNMFSRSGSALFIFGASIVIRDLFISGFEEFAKALGVGRFHNYILNPESKKEAYLSIIGFGILILGEIMTSYGDLIMLKLLK